MIRLPATSISLSPDDLAHHMQEAQALHNMVNRGIPQEDALDFIQRRRPRPIGGPGPGILEDPRAVEDVEEDSGTSSENTVSTYSPPEQQGDPATPKEEADSSSPALPSSPFPAGRPHHRATVRQSSLLRFAQNAASSSDLSEAAASPRSSAATHIEPLSVMPRRARSYRPRSETYPFVDSEPCQSEDLTNPLSSLATSSRSATSTNTMGQGLTNAADVPSELATPLQSLSVALTTTPGSQQPIPSSPSYAVSPTQAISTQNGPIISEERTASSHSCPSRPATPQQNCLALPSSTGNPSFPSPSSSPLADLPPPAFPRRPFERRSQSPIDQPSSANSHSTVQAIQSDPTNHASPLGSFSISQFPLPPTSTPSNGDRRSSPSTTAIVHPNILPTTPSPPSHRTANYRAWPPPWTPPSINQLTEPRPRRRRPEFTPYNDALPASTQPQTPAQLTHTPHQSTWQMAYTAPPGRTQHSIRLDNGTNISFATLANSDGSPTRHEIRRRQVHERRRRYLMNGTATTVSPLPPAGGETGPTSRTTAVVVPDGDTGEGDPSNTPQPQTRAAATAARRQDAINGAADADGVEEEAWRSGLRNDGSGDENRVGYLQLVERLERVRTWRDDDGRGGRGG